MKGVISLGLLCLFVCSVSSTGSLSRNAAQVSLSRAAADCHYQCDLVEGSNPNSKSWVFKLGVNLTVIYNAEANYLAIFNAKLNISFILHFKGFLAVVNHKSGSIVVVNLKTNVAIYVKGSGAFSGEITVAIEAAFQIVLANEGKISGTNVDVSVGFVFDFSLILDLSVNFQARLDLLNELKSNFGDLIEKVRDAVNRHLVAIEAGLVSCCLYVVMGVEQSVTVLVTAVFKLGLVLIRALERGVEITEAFMARLLAALLERSEQIQAKLIDTLTKVLQGVGKFFKTIDEALQKAKEVVYSTSSLVLVNGKLRLQVSLTLAEDLSWTFEIENTEDVTEKVYVIYHKSTNLFLFRNTKSKLLLVYTGKDTKYALFNTGDGAGIVVDYKRGGLFRTEYGAAALIAKNDKLTAAFKAGGVLPYELIQETVEKATVPKEAQFNIVDILEKKPLKASAEVQATLKASFGALFSYSGSTRQGQAVLVALVFGGLDVSTFSSGFVLFINLILGAGGRYNASLMVIVSLEIRTFMVAGFIGNMLGNLTKKLAGLVTGLLNNIVATLGKLFGYDDLTYKSLANVSFQINFSVAIHLKATIGGGGSAQLEG